MTDRRQLVKECVEIEKLGGSVREFLACRGFISPWGTWFRLQREELGRDRYHITDGKGGKDMRKLTLEDKKKAVEIALAGGNPLKFLKEAGAGNPSASWNYIKKILKEKDPEAYDRLTQETEEIPAADKGVTVTLVGQDAVNSYYSDGSVAKRTDVTIRQEDLEKIEPVGSTIAKPVNYDGFDVMAVKSPETGFRFEHDPRLGLMTWRTIEGDEVTKTPEEWHRMAEELPKVLQIFGI